MTVALSFETFCADVLAPWSSDEPITADSHARTPKAAAKLGLYRAAMAEGKGTILIIAPAGDVKAVQSYIAAMVEGQGLLDGLGEHIEICTPERAPLVRNPSHIIELRPAAPEHDATPWDAFTVARKLAHLAASATDRGDTAELARISELLGIDLADWLERVRQEARHRREEPGKPLLLPYSTPPMFLLSPPQDGFEEDRERRREALRRAALAERGIGDDGYFTPEHERKMMEAHTAIKPKRQERAITSRSLYRHGGSVRERML